MIAAPRFLVTLLPQYQSQLFPTFVLVLFVYILYVLSNISSKLSFSQSNNFYQFVRTLLESFISFYLRYFYSHRCCCRKVRKYNMIALFYELTLLSYKRTSYTFFLIELTEKVYYIIPFHISYIPLPFIYFTY